jgi:hypothetical protein
VFHRLGLVFAILLFASASLQAQVENKPFLEEDRRREMDERVRSNEDLQQSFLWDAGGWFNSQFVQLDDPPDKDQRTLRSLDLRLWGEARIARRYLAYVRLQSEYTDFNSGDQFEGSDDNQFRPIHVDQAYLEADWSSPDNEFIVRVGKEFLTLGRGLLFNSVAYGVMGSYASGPFSLRGFAAHTIIHDDDIDQSLPNSDDSRRAFAALEGGYTLSGGHRAYLLAMVERDLNDEDPESASQDWDYNASYVGVGARGTVSGDLVYSMEGIMEFGKSVAAGSTEEESIQAFALMVGLELPFGGAMSPYAALEYMFGSGDSDRGSVTDVASGNLAGTDDEGFLAFGFVQTGFSLFPRLSNLHILRLGGSLRPLESVELFRRMEVGIFGYLYRKHQSEAPISDSRSSEDDADVGTEVDLFLHWRLLSDVGLSINYGRFMPGDAYADGEDARDFVSAGITYGF